MILFSLILSPGGGRFTDHAVESWGGRPRRPVSHLIPFPKPFVSLPLLIVNQLPFWGLQYTLCCPYVSYCKPNELTWFTIGPMRTEWELKLPELHTFPNFCAPSPSTGPPDPYTFLTRPYTSSVRIKPAWGLIQKAVLHLLRFYSI
jgi:hypothetical protein